MPSSEKPKRSGKWMVVKSIVFPLVLLLIVAAVVLGVYYTRLGDAAEQRVYRLLMDSTRAQSVAMEERVKSCFEQLELIAAGIDWEQDVYTDADTLAKMKTAVEKSQFDNLGIVKRGGKLLYQNGTTADCSDRPYIANALNGEQNVQFLRHGRMSGEAVFVFASPVYINGRVDGVAVATRKMQAISAMLESGKEIDSQNNILCYADGEIISGSLDGVELSTGDQLSRYFADFSFAIQETQEDVATFRYDGKEYYGICTSSGLDDIYIFSVVDKSYASYLAGSYIKWSLTVIVGLFFLMLAGAIITIGQLRRRITAVQQREAEHRRQLEDYYRFQNKRPGEHARVVASYHVNLTQDRVAEDRVEGRRAFLGNDPVDTEAVGTWVHDHMYPGDWERYQERLSRDSLMAAFDKGAKSAQEDFLFYREGVGYLWMRVAVDLAQNPMTEDLEAVVCVLNVNREKRLMQAGQKLINEKFAAMGLLDVRSGRVYGVKALSAGKPNQIIETLVYDEVAHRALKKLLTPHDYAEIIDRVTLKAVQEQLEIDGEYKVVLHVVQNGHATPTHYQARYSYLDDRHESIMVSCEDITDLLDSKIDTDTGLYNYVGFHEQVREWVRRHPGQKYRMMRYNIDGFRNINGTYGYEAGNKLLHDIGQYLHRGDSADSFAGHLNSDHFVRFCSADSPSPDECYAQFLEYFRHYELPYPLSLHIGVYDLCEPDCDSFTMSYKAHLALQSIKGDMSTHIAYYKKGLLQATKEEQRLLAEVENAVQDHQLEVWFQPQYRYPDRRIIGAEALVRWRHPERGLIMPSDFVPLLERSKQITIVDAYVWEQTCRFVAEMRDKGIAVPVSVNISREDVNRSDVYAALTGLVQRYDIPPRLLRLEITESAYMKDPRELTAMVEAFRNSGFVVEMDDFGSGYSSLNMLKDLDIDVLKLDRKLIAEIGGDHDKSNTILQSVVSMAHSLHLALIAEGIETREQADYLQSIGCEDMQGFYFSKPLPMADFRQLLQQ